LQHMLDAERILAYRALCIARGEQQSLPGFDEDAYAAATTGRVFDADALTNELHATQTSTLALFSSFTPQDLARTGTANGQPRTPHDLALSLAGHTLHHLAVLRERYGIGAKPVAY
jgi:DinB superfamily